jgi:hypothetical protein
LRWLAVVRLCVVAFAVVAAGIAAGVFGHLHREFDQFIRSNSVVLPSVLPF